MFLCFAHIFFNLQSANYAAQYLLYGHVWCRFSHFTQTFTSHTVMSNKSLSTSLCLLWFIEALCFSISSLYSKLSHAKLTSLQNPAIYSIYHMDRSGVPLLILCKGSFPTMSNKTFSTSLCLLCQVYRGSMFHFKSIQS